MTVPNLIVETRPFFTTFLINDTEYLQINLHPYNITEDNNRFRDILE